MLLAIDVGNTQTVIGMFTPGRGNQELLHHWRISSNAERTADEMAMIVSQLLDLQGFDIDRTVTGIAVASVVPRVTAALREMTEKWFPVKTVIVEPGIRTGMPILYDNPQDVGADRIADAVAAYDLYGGPTIVIDFGTATTVEAIQSGSVYGFAAQVDGLCARFQHELGQEATVVATGGLAGLITPLTERIDHHEPWLTLYGLRIIYERNVG